VLGPEEDEDGNPVGLVYFCAMAKDGAAQIAREDWGKQSPEQLLHLAINRAFDLIESCVDDTRVS
jgi:nicotinamide mononucleotide (NMN) deamidase PncC